MTYIHAMNVLSVTCHGLYTSDTCSFCDDLASSALSCDVLIKVNMVSFPFGAWRQPYWHVLICLVTFSTGLLTCSAFSSKLGDKLTHVNHLDVTVESLKSMETFP